MTIIELRKNGTPVSYLKLRVRYDRWGDPYVKPNLFQELFSDFMGPHVLNPTGSASGGYNIQWKHVSGPEVVFPDNRTSRGWKPGGR